ncbi:glycosyltransferase involved in cell wall biosynthesis [Branchiibius hedensis]|uniref:Glycosyltransferase involved in cell wall bisynthesis n=1 Tax=Branchiibius hedensis TaxID=672460 RepID=A0A2Y8ZTX3_9MICO|nr:glycosyltransferase family 4 protein [Branchiibius hedensis]PWJ26144.1 glycosyltransferase involved in cell wall biosynthesis [Branchiibius hedensis]SSA34956.1 Glycosyltransferase involved in cell wall bisynthesis [Branchiibius hedensis]
MKIAHVVRSDGFAGVEAHILALAPALVALGVDVRVIGGDPARLAQPLSTFGIQHSPAASVRDVTRQTAGLRRWKPDLIHAHMTAAECGVLGACPVLRAPLVSTRHFAELRGAGTRWERAYRLLDHTATQVSVSHAVAAAIDTPSTVIHPGVTAPPPDRERTKTVLIAQRLELEKDTRTGIEAFTRSGLADRGWRLLIAGGGADEAALRALPDHAIEILGYRTDVRELLAQASIFLATSPSEHFGISVVEAMAAGTPVVATNRAGHLETAGAVSPETLFPPGDSVAAATILADLAEDSRRRADLGEALRADYLSRFTVEECARRHVALYERVLR